MIEQTLEVGDSIKLGNDVFPIIGRLMSDFGSIALGSSFAPTVYLGLSNLNGTGLIQPGSLLDYNYYFKVPESYDLSGWDARHHKAFRDESLRTTVVEDQRENLNEAFSSLNSFLNLIALVSLILGCIGVASSVFIYIKSKIPSVAIFRCLGMSGRDAFLIYFMQIIGLGVLSVFYRCRAWRINPSIPSYPSERHFAI